MCLTPGFELHVDHGIGNEEAADGEPRPRIDPPGRGNKDQGSPEAPRYAGIRNDDHGRIDRVGLLEKRAHDPECLRWECPHPVELLNESVRCGKRHIPSLIRKSVGRPEYLKDGVEIGQWTG